MGLVGLHVDKDKASLTKIKTFMKQVKSQATDLRIIAFDSKFYALKHGTIKNAIVDKDRPSLIKIKNLHETGQIMSYRPDNHRFRLELLRPETWEY